MALREVMPALLRGLPQGGRVAEYRVWTVWDDVVGKIVARKAQPVKIQDGRLLVAVSDSMWLQELQFLKGLLREKLNERLGGGVVREIFFLLGRRRPIHREREQRRVLEEIIASCPPMDNSALEASFQALLDAYRRRRERDAAESS